MSKIVKVSLVVLAVLPVLCNCETLAVDKQEADVQSKIENFYNGARVLVEVLIVEVKPEAMEKAGLGPLSKEQATGAKILDIINDKNAGRILICEKLAMVSPGEADIRVSGRKDIPVKNDPNNGVTSWMPYDTGSNIKADIKIEPDGRILLGFRMDITLLNEDSRAENKSPEVSSYSCNSRVMVRSGIPVIVSAIESKDRMRYMILRANIEEDSLPQSVQH